MHVASLSALVFGAFCVSEIMGTSRPLPAALCILTCGPNPFCWDPRMHSASLWKEKPITSPDFIRLLVEQVRFPAGPVVACHVQLLIK